MKITDEFVDKYFVTEISKIVEKIAQDEKISLAEAQNRKQMLKREYISYSLF